MIELSKNSVALLENSESPAADSITYQVLTDLPAIEEVSAEWDSLLSRTFVNQAFGSSKWFIASCRNDASVSPYVILARRWSRLAGVLPLALTADAETAAFPDYLCDYNDIIALEEDAPVIEGLVRYALSNSRGYKKIILSHVRRDSNCFRAVESIHPDRDIDELYGQSNTCYYIDLPASYDDYLKTKGSHFRKRLKRIHGIACENNLVVRELGPENISADGLVEAFLSLHLNRHGARSCFETFRGRSFVEEVFPALFRERRIRALALVEGEKLIGIDIYTMGADSLCVWNGGFLSEAEAFSPGKLLIDAGVKLAYGLNLSEFDLLRGHENYKMSWVTDSRPIGLIELPVI
jgi:CelD/BcsL family acetyltransferase involved in cellulose biosynthesis